MALTRQTRHREKCVCASQEKKEREQSLYQQSVYPNAILSQGALLRQSPVNTPADEINFGPENNITLLGEDTFIITILTQHGIV